MDSIVNLIVMLVVIGTPVILLVRAAKRRSDRARAVYWASVNNHRIALARRYLHLVRTNDYGRLELGGWRKERTKFIREIIKEEMFRAKVSDVLIQRTIESQDLRFDEVISGYANEMTAGLSFDPHMSPTEFEQLCAEILRRHGWEAELTSGSGDQGVDIVAMRGGQMAVIQCKLYSKPVGNKAVQEVFSAKAHMKADLAAVVSNQPYTPSAKQLASTTATRLLHFTELHAIG